MSGRRRSYLHEDAPLELHVYVQNDDFLSENALSSYIQLRLKNIS